MESTFEMYTGRYMFLENGNDIEITEEGFKDRIINAAKNPEELKRKIREWIKKFCEFMRINMGKLISKAKLLKARILKLKNGSNANKIFNKEVRALLIKLDKRLEGRVDDIVTKLGEGPLSPERIGDVINKSHDVKGAMTNLDSCINSALSPLMGLIGQSAGAIETGDKDKLIAFVGTKRDNLLLKNREMSKEMSKMNLVHDTVILDDSHITDISKFNNSFIQEMGNELTKIMNATDDVDIDPADLAGDWADKYGVSFAPVDNVKLSVDHVNRLIDELENGKFQSPVFTKVYENSEKCKNMNNLGIVKKLLTYTQTALAGASATIFTAGVIITDSNTDFMYICGKYIGNKISLAIYDKVLDSVRR